MKGKKVNKMRLKRNKKKSDKKLLYSFFVFIFLLIGLFTIIFYNTSSPHSNTLYAQSCSNPAPTTPDAYKTLFDIHNNQWSGADAGRSFKLPDGRILWLWGDTIIGKIGSGGTMINNTAFVQDKGCITVLSGGRKAWIVPPAKYSGDQFYWPGDGFIDGGQLKLFMGRYTPTQIFPKFGGADLATIDVSGGTPKLVNISDTPGSNTGGDNATIWGNAVVAETDFVYIYGTRMNVNTEGRLLYVARAPRAQVSDGASWTYWDGGEWSNTLSKAAVILPSSEKMSHGISIHAIPNRSYKYILVSKELEFTGNKILAFTASAPQGPWKQEQPLLNPIPDPNAEFRTKKAVTYLALLHPEIPMASGKMLLSYSRNSLSENFADVKAHPNIYNLLFVEVTLPGEAAGGGSGNPGSTEVEPTLYCMGGIPCGSPAPSGGPPGNTKSSLPSTNPSTAGGGGDFLTMLINFFMQLFGLITGSMKK